MSHLSFYLYINVIHEKNPRHYTAPYKPEDNISNASAKYLFLIIFRGAYGTRTRDPMRDRQGILTN